MERLGCWGLLIGGLFLGQSQQEKTEKAEILCSKQAKWGFCGKNGCECIMVLRNSLVGDDDMTESSGEKLRFSEQIEFVKLQCGSI